MEYSEVDGFLRDRNKGDDGKPHADVEYPETVFYHMVDGFSFIGNGNADPSDEKENKGDYRAEGIEGCIEWQDIVEIQIPESMEEYHEKQCASSDYV